jgi:uncharacterized protein (DUF2235 family)
MAQAVVPIASDGVYQPVFYDEGLGTEWLNKWTGGALGWGIDQNIQDAYRFLCFNYSPGDEIYLFGFSRGAYTVRSLVGLIYCSGLLARDNIGKIAEAYKLYRDRAIRPSNPVAETFRQENGDRVPITVLGCWDTVGALGVPDIIPILPIDNWLSRGYRFHDTELSAIIQHALHAVAIDEIRKPFDVTPMQRSKNPKAQSQVLYQVWFPGDHGCVGGGTEAYRGLSDGALYWMMSTIKELGLKLDFKLDGLCPINPSTPFDNRLKGIYVLGGKQLRTITDGIDMLHESVAKRWCDLPDYRPANLESFQEHLDAQCTSK